MHLTITRRFGLAMAATLGMTLLAMAVLAWGFLTAERLAHQMSRVDWPLCEVASELEINAVELAADVKEFQATHIQIARYQFVRDRGEFLVALAQFERLAATSRLRANGRRLRDLFEDLSHVGDLILDDHERRAAMVHGGSSAFVEAHRTLERRFFSLRQSIDTLLDDDVEPEIDRAWRVAEASLQRTMRHVVQLSVLIASVIVLTAVASSWWFWHSVQRPMRQLMAGVGALGRGRFSHRVQMRTRDEFGALGRALDGMADHVQRSQGELRAVSRHLESAEERERAHIAREIHDELGQGLTILKLGLGRLDGGCPRSSSSDLCARVSVVRSELIPVVDQCIETTRRVASGLRPAVLDELGLAAAVEWQGGGVERRSGIVCEFERVGTDVPIAPDRARTCFRVLQEALTNVARHSRADHVFVRLDTTSERVALDVVDNGVGLPPDAFERGSLGLVGMRERAAAMDAELAVDREEPTGTRVRIVMAPDECRPGAIATFAEDGSAGEVHGPPAQAA